MLKELINERRSIRKYEEKKVDHEKIEEILSYAVLGPVYGGTRNVEFILVEDKEKLEELSQMQKFGTLYIKDLPALVIILNQDSKYWIEEASIAAAYLQLLAQEEGLNTSFIDVRDGKTKDGEDYQKYFRQMFNIPKDKNILAMIPLGYGHERVRKREAVEIKSKLHYEKY